MKFYTSVVLLGNDILVRGYENGKHFTKREPFQPRFFVPSKRESKYKTLDGQDVEPIRPGTIRECREFLDKYNDVNGFKVYGNDRFVYQFLLRIILRTKSNLISQRSKLLQLILRLQRRVDSPMCSTALKNFY